jgi:prevent-host-death family protein
MSKQVNLYEAKTKLSELVEEAARGNEIIIAKNGKAMARLVMARSESGAQRSFGQWGPLLTPDELASFRSEEWWRQWKQTDSEIAQEFGLAVGEGDKEESEWRAISSIQTPSSGSRHTPAKSGRKRSRN